ncbi:MAG: DUF5655 domain-containing protein [Anaerolineae bacterium]
MAATPLVKKLRIQKGQRALVLNPPEGYLEALGDLPEDFEFLHEPEGRFDFVHLFLKNSEDHARLGRSAIQAVKDDGLFWISYPKKSANVESDLSREAVWDLMKGTGLRPVAQVSFDEVWSAMRFRPGEMEPAGDPVESQYAGRKEDLKPIYNQLVEIAQGLGPDVKLAPRKTYVGLVRAKVFGVIMPSTATRLDLGVKLPGTKGGDRLQEAPGFGSGSITHKVALTSLDQIDEELTAWLRAAYEAAD